MPSALVCTLALLGLALFTGAAGVWLLAGVGWTLLYLAACFAAAAYVLMRGARVGG